MVCCCFLVFISAQWTDWWLGVTQAGKHNRLTAVVYGDRGYDGGMTCNVRISGLPTGLHSNNLGRIWTISRKHRKFKWNIMYFFLQLCLGHIPYNVKVMLEASTIFMHTAVNLDIWSKPFKCWERHSLLYTKIKISWKWFVLNVELLVRLDKTTHRSYRAGPKTIWHKC